MALEPALVVSMFGERRRLVSGLFSRINISPNAFGNILLIGPHISSRYNIYGAGIICFVLCSMCITTTFLLCLSMYLTVWRPGKQVVPSHTFSRWDALGLTCLCVYASCGDELTVQSLASTLQGTCNTARMFHCP